MLIYNLFFKGSFRCEKKKCDFGEILNEHGQCAKISCGGGFEIGPFGNCMVSIENKHIYITKNKGDLIKGVKPRDTA